MKTQTYIITIPSQHGERSMGEVTFPSDPSCANFFGVCFYNPETDSFLGDTEVDGYLLIRKENYFNKQAVELAFLNHYHPHDLSKEAVPPYRA